MIWLATHMFGLCLLSFVAGTVSSALLLVQPALRQARERSTVRSSPTVVDALPIQRTLTPAALPSAPEVPQQWPRGDDTPAFASSSTNTPLDVIVVVGSEPSTDDPARCSVPISEVTTLGDEQDEPATFHEPAARHEPATFHDPGVAEEPAFGDTARPVAQAGPALATAEAFVPDTEYVVKGNTRSMRYHTMDSPYFERTKAGAWFRSIDEAEQAGFTAWNERRPKVR